MAEVALTRPARIVSGGQSGADYAALRAAKALHVPSGGWMPRGFKTEWGPRPWYADQFGMREHSSEGYTARTFANLMEADATVLFGSLAGPGSWQTYQKCLRAKKPIRVNPVPADLAAWVSYLNHARGQAGLGPITLNVAGNRETLNPGIEAYVFAVLVRAWDLEGRIATPMHPEKAWPRLTTVARQPIVIGDELRAFLHHTTPHVGIGGSA